MRNSLTNPGVTFKVSTGYLNVTNNQKCTLGNAYSNNTLWLTYRGCEDSQSIFTFWVLSYGNGTLTLRFAGGQPSLITQSAATSAYSPSAGWQQLTYTANQNSILVIIFTTNPRLSLIAGAYIAAAFLVFLVVVRTAMVAYAPNADSRYSVLVKNRKIFLTMCLVLMLIVVLTLLFP